MSRRRSHLAVGAILLGSRQVEGFAPRLVGTSGVSLRAESRSCCLAGHQNSDGPEQPPKLCIGGTTHRSSFSSRLDSRLYVGSSIDPSEDRDQTSLTIHGTDSSSENADLCRTSLKIDGTDGSSSSSSDNADLLPTDSDSNQNLPLSALWSMLTGTGGGPPLQVDDTNVLLYDVFLLVNLSASISFWVVHRMNFMYIAESLNEGALLCICWILAGLANGAFLYSAVDGHWDPSGKDADKGGPKAAGLLGLSTFIGTASIRIIIALAVSISQHRPVGSGGEALIPLEILVGLILMSSWRALHSAYTPRL